MGVADPVLFQVLKSWRVFLGSGSNQQSPSCTAGIVLLSACSVSLSALMQMGAGCCYKESSHFFLMKFLWFFIICIISTIAFSHDTSLSTPVTVYFPVCCVCSFTGLTDLHDMWYPLLFQAHVHHATLSTFTEVCGLRLGEAAVSRRNSLPCMPVFPL